MKVLIKQRMVSLCRQGFILKKAPEPGRIGNLDGILPSAVQDVSISGHTYMKTIRSASFMLAAAISASFFADRIYLRKMRKSVIGLFAFWPLDRSLRGGR